MFRRLFWLSVFVGVGYMVWRWAQRQSEASTPATTAQLFTPPPAEAPSPAASTGRRPIPTRVHRGAPPPPPRPASAPAIPFGDAPAINEADTWPAPAADASAMSETDAQPSPPAATPAEAEPAEAEPAEAEPAEAEPAEAEPAEAEPAEAEPAEAEPAEAEPAPLNTTEAPSIQTLVAPAGDAPLTNINTADEAALIALPGIGPALARRIIAYREANGPFATIDQLEVIQGIGHRNIGEFRHLVTV